MFDDLYPEASEAALTAKAARPPEPQPTQRFSVWGMLSAAPKGVAAGAAQGAASGADLTKAVRDKVLANVSGPLGHIPFVNAITSAMQVGADILNPTEGQFTSEVGTSLRNVAKDYTPDPQTTHVAESAVFNLFRVGSKALTAAAAGGNIPGAVIAGAEEGFSTADDLARQGVDIKTRTKVGAVTAATNAVGFALPAAGKTWAQTGALALAGGPVSFMAQNQATREILQNADYSKLADQYDPLDPLGLALSTLLPLGFGALAMRGARGRNSGAQGVAQGVAPLADSPPAIHPPADLVDAARVTLLREQMDASNPARGDMAADNAHNAALTKALDQQANGERVSVDIPEVMAVKATQEMAARVESATQSQRVEVAIKPDTNFLQAKSDAGMVGGTIRDGALHINFAEVDPAMRGQGEGVALYSALIDDALAKGLRVFSDSTVEASAVRVYEALARRGYEVKLIGAGVLEDGAHYGKGAKEPAFEVVGKTELKPELVRADTAQAATKTVAEASTFNPAALATQASDLLAGGKTAGQVIGELEAGGTKVTPELQNMLVGASEFGGRINDLVDQVNTLRKQRGTNAQPFDLIAQAVENLRTGTKAEAPKLSNPLEDRLAEIEVRNPTALDAEIPVEFDDNGKPSKTVTAREYLDMVKKEAAADAQGADLIEVAANCFLSGGM